MSGVENGRSSPPSSSLPAAPPTSSPLAAYPRWIWIGLGVAAFLLLLWLTREPVWELLSLLQNQEAVSAYVQEYGAWGPLVLAIVQLVQVLVAVIPGHVFLVAAGYVYGFLPGLLLNVVCTVGASQLGFALARWAGRPFVHKLVTNKELLERWYRIGEERGFVFFTISFVLPVFPTDVMNFVGGLSGISGRKFLAANFLGRLPSAIMLTLIGSHGLEFGNAAWAAIGVLAVTVFLVGRYAAFRIERRYKRQSTPAENEKA